MKTGGRLACWYWTHLVHWEDSPSLPAKFKKQNKKNSEVWIRSASNMKNLKSQSLCPHLWWQGNLVVTEFRSKSIIQQNILDLYVIPKNARSNSSVQELDSPRNANDNRHSLWPSQHLPFSLICRIKNQSYFRLQQDSNDKKKKKIKWCLLFYQLGNLLEIHWRCVQGQQILCQLGSNDPDMWRWCVRECWPNADASALIVPQSAESCFEVNSSALVSHISPGLLNHLWDNLYRAVDYSTE